MGHHKFVKVFLYRLVVRVFFTGLVVRVFANGRGDLGSIPGRVIPMTLKMAVDTSLLDTQQYKVMVKWSNPADGVVPSPTPR